MVGWQNMDGQKQERAEGGHWSANILSKSLLILFKKLFTHYLCKNSPFEAYPHNSISSEDHSAYRKYISNRLQRVIVHTDIKCSAG